MKISDLSPRARELHDMVNIDPVSIVTQLLTEDNHPNPTAWLQYLHPNAGDPNMPAEAKRVLVNQAWRMIFGNYSLDTGINTEHPRYCLVDQGPLNVWLVLFYQSILPAIVEHKLPR